MTFQTGPTEKSDIAFFADNMPSRFGAQFGIGTLQTHAFGAYLFTLVLFALVVRLQTPAAKVGAAKETGDAGENVEMRPLRVFLFYQIQEQLCGFLIRIADPHKLIPFFCRNHQDANV